MTEPILEIPIAKPSTLSLEKKKDLLRRPEVRNATDLSVIGIDRRKEPKLYRGIHNAAFNAATNVSEHSRRKLAEMREVVQKDPLTRLLSRAGFDERLREETARISRSGGKAVWLVLDGINIKGINDIFGHMEGDAAIVEIARAIEVHKRLSDPAGRWGGDEFQVLLLDADIEGSRVFFERINKTLSHVKINDNAIGLSVGGGAVMLDLKNPEKSREEVFKLMEESKRIRKTSGNREKPVFLASAA